MNRRGEIAVTTCLIAGLIMAACGAVMNLMGMGDQSTNSLCAACFFMLWAVYLEVYAHRG